MLGQGLNHAETVLFKALGDETRLGLLNALVERERNVGDLVALVAKEQSAVSHHLRCLRSCGLVRTRKAGKEVFYSLSGNGRVAQMLTLARAHAEETVKAIIACDVVGDAAPNVTLSAPAPLRLRERA